jgi:Adenylate and Guanylate cyclase catalytic domain
MAEERTQRRLAAVLAADVVGFSRLMEQDETGTLTALKARRKEVLEPLVAHHRGRTFKVTGDGVLVEFASAVNAVECAAELQHAMAAANSGLPEDRRIVLRIGINLGTSSSRAAIAMARASILLRGSKRLQNPAAFAFRRKCMMRCGASSQLTATIWASRDLKTLRRQCGSFVS